MTKSCIELNRIESQLQTGSFKACNTEKMLEVQQIQEQQHRAFTESSNAVKKIIVREKCRKEMEKVKEVTGKQINQSSEMGRIKRNAAIMIAIAVACLIIGFSMSFMWPIYFQKMLQKELILTPNSTSYKAWKETPIPMYLKIYLYNWTNYDDVIRDSSIKPNFNQMGPYVFREVDAKVNTVWNSNGTVTFQNKRVWHFLPEESSGTLSDRVTNLNPIASTVTYMTRNYNHEIKRFLNLFLKTFERATITKQVKELLFDGFNDKLLELGKLLKHLNISKIPFDKFAWFYSRNGSETYDGTFNMLTGSSNFNSLGELKEWKFDKMSENFPSCGEIKGTMGDLWPPLPNNKTISIFSPDICTTLTLKASGTMNLLGLKGTNYVSDVEMFDNGTKVPSRKCYCQDTECRPSGTLNISSCKFGAPAFVSLPHFYLADKSYTSNITGMNPNQDDHEFRLVIQPDTGIPLQVRGTLQINFFAEPDPDYSIFSNLPRMYVPMLWFRQEAAITPDFASQIKILNLVPLIINGVLYSLIGIGVLLIITSITMYVRQKIKEDQLKLLANEQDNRDKENEENVNTEG